METAFRSLIKTIIYRIFIFITTTIFFILTGSDPMKALGESIALNIFYTVCYYVNERIWNKIKWGKTNE
jgi:uncharacterized membrane protein